VGPAGCRIGPIGPGAEPGLAVDFAQATAAGPGREGNEDAIGCWPLDGGLALAVADGLGGYEAGERASKLAIEVLGSSLAIAPAHWRAVRRLRHAVEEANLAVHDAGQGRMRTTLTATLLGPATLSAVHVGDCRLLLFRDGVLRQLTADHNVAGHMAARGLLSARGMARHPGRRILTRCLGQDPFIRVDTISLPIRAGDVCVQCSDGIAWLSGPRMIEVLVAYPPAAASERLLREVQAAGGDDDISIQVLSILSCAVRPRAGWLELSRRLRAWRRGGA
jgi:protein phosphatase